MATNTIIKKKEGISLQVKINVIKDVEKDVDYDVILQKYKLKNKSNISQIWKLRYKYLEAYNSPYASPLNKSLKTTKLSAIDDGYLDQQWVSRKV